MSNADAGEEVANFDGKARRSVQSKAISYGVSELEVTRLYRYFELKRNLLPSNIMGKVVPDA